MGDLTSAAAPKMPIPMGVLAKTGDIRPALTEKDLLLISPNSAAALAKGAPAKDYAVSYKVKDPTNLKQAGWCVVFASDEVPEVEAALAPLLKWRQEQVGNDDLFQIFKGKTGVKPGQPAMSWASVQGVSLNAPADPTKGVPYYLLIVGSPEKISFEFQQEFDLQWAVGRLYFDNVQDYAAYAEKVVAYEKGQAPAQSRRAALWMPRNPLDLSTPMLAGTLVPDFLGTAPKSQPLGAGQSFQTTGFIGDGQATKDKLSDILRGNIEGGAPSLLFTGSHGSEWPIDDPDIQRARQGSIVTQSWVKGRPLQPGDYFTAEDVPSDAKVHGLMYFMFACFGGGCPSLDSYFFDEQGARIKLTPAPFVAALPQKLLSLGTLAVIAHVDRSFSYAFMDVMDTPQEQLLRTPLEYLTMGQPVGMATDSLNQQWGSIAAVLGDKLGGNAPGPPQPQSPVVANLYIARDEARNYVVLGDPAVRLNVGAMK